MLNKKWVAGAVLAAFLTVGVGTGTTQAYASERGPAAIQITAGDRLELGRHHGGPKHIDRHRDHRGPKHISHRDHRPPDRHPPHHRPHRSSSGNTIVGGIIGGIIGGILVNSSK